MATGRATSKVTMMRATRASTLPPKPVTTISAPKTKKVTTWKIALTFSLKVAKVSGRSRTMRPSATAATKAAIRPLP